MLFLGEDEVAQKKDTARRQAILWLMGLAAAYRGLDLIDVAGNHRLIDGAILGKCCRVIGGQLVAVHLISDSVTHATPPRMTSAFLPVNLS